MKEKLARQYDNIMQRIAEAKMAHQAEQSVTMLAISKKQTPEAVAALYDVGQRQFGENYLQEALNKQQALAHLGITWHFVGPIQSNKTKKIAEHFSWVHSIDRLKTAEALNRHRPQSLPELQVCIQVNIDQDPNKAGVSVEQLPALAQQVHAMDRLTLRGLMVLPSKRPNYAEQRQVFAQARAAFLLMQSINPQCDTLSMGMSKDLEAAIAEGSTMVRVGTDLMGARETV